jgi:hypothetical protein
VGSRQSHIAPALSDGLQPVVIAGDTRADPRTSVPASYATVIEIIPDGTNVKRASFVNPNYSATIAVLRRLHVYLAEDMYNDPSTALSPTKFVYSLVPFFPTAVNNIVHGNRLVSGFVNSSILQPVAGPPPPAGTFDVGFPPSQSVCGFMSPPQTGITGGYIWQGFIGNGGVPAATGGELEILENFNVDSGPRIIVYPGGNVEFYPLQNTVHWYTNLWWDEYPLT